MVIRIDEDLCSGCGSCTEICPEIFILEDDRVINQIGEKPIPRQNEEACREAAESCPTEAIAID
ncbi:MAG: ferredoxin [Syntrophorhabdaceae bacterium]